MEAVDKDCFFLKNSAALVEINQHKWLESEKAGRDIGFVAAAVDWINRYGEEWRRFFTGENKDTGVFSERREFRRFKLNTHVKLIGEGGLCFARLMDLSVFGILCKTYHHFKIGYRARIHFTAGTKKDADFTCIGTLARILRHEDSESYELFFRFDENIQKDSRAIERLRESLFLE